MLFTNPLHETTRRVLLPEAWENTPEQVQVNYYNYLQRRLIPSTDIYIGARLIYRTNALGCRGDDILPDEPILAFFGDAFVHGTLDSNPIEAIRLEPFQIVNAGIEGVSLQDVAARLIELHAAAPLSVAVIVAPVHDLAPEHPRSLYGPPCAESAWRDALEQLPAEVETILVLPPTLSEAPDQKLAGRYVRFLQAYCTEKRLELVDAREVRERPSLKNRASQALQRLSARLARPPAIVTFLQARLAPLKAKSAEIQPPPAAAPAPVALDQHDAAPHGPADTGKNYPLW